LILWTGLPSYFFHPPWLPVELQNRAVALSYYATAPLALMPLVPIAASAFLFVELSRSEQLPAAVLVSGGVLHLLLIGSWSAAVRYGRIMLRRPARVAALYLLLPLLLSSGALICVFVLPMLVVYVALIFYSLL
jgi:hypothetical protein